MNKYTYGKWAVRCSFCGTKGHNIRSCPDVIRAARDHEYKHWDAFQVATAQGEINRREELAKRSSKPRQKPRCGFCGAKKHNRKNCPKLKKMRKQVYRANARWRRQFVERVNVLGINEGALVQVKGLPAESVGLHKPFGLHDVLSSQKRIGIVEPFDLVSLNVFCNFLGVWDYRSQADVKAKVTTEKGFVSVSLGRYVGEDLFYKSAFFTKYSSIKVITRSQWTNPKEWINQEDIPPLEWLLKTHRLEELKDLQIIAFLEKWT